jgi:putative transposase
MQIKSLRIKSYRSWHVNETTISSKAQERERKILLYQKLKAEGCAESTALEAIQTSRATFYRWHREYRQQGTPGLNPKSKRPAHLRKPVWTKALQQLVYQIRQQHPYWGKLKIQCLIEREHGIKTTVSTVGRIIRHLINLKRIQPVAVVVGRAKPRKRRVFNQHARRWEYGMKAKEPGELIQVDHMTVYCNSQRIKDFKAACPVTKMLVTEVYQNATSNTAKRFLEKMQAEFPFPIKSIQVDGGSEFMAEFEQACKEKGIALFVLPPKSPKYNGDVERKNGISRNEFYSQYRQEFTVGAIRLALARYQKLYNTYRPHQTLANLTPMEYFKSNYQIRAA